MLEIFLSNNNYIFSSAIYLMLFIVLLEVILGFVGVGMTEFINHIDLPHNDFLSESLGWFNKAGIPVSIYFIIFLTSFGFTGITVQYLSQEYLSQYTVLIPVILITLFISKEISNLIKHIIPKDETTAVSRKNFIGKIATITIGVAKKGAPTEAKVIDVYNQTHYIIIEPIDDKEYIQGDKVLLLKEEGHLFKVTGDINKSLEEENK